MKRTRTVVALVASLLGIFATPGAAQTAQTLTVTPDTDLSDGDVVTLAGTGFTASDEVGYCQGVFDETPDAGDCDSFPSLGRIGFSDVNTAGEFSAQYTVRRFIAVAGIGTVDCAQPSANCAISASNVSGFSVVGPPTVTPVAFTSLPPPSLAVAPDADLLDGDVVTVDGSGFRPSRSGFVCQAVDDGAFSPTDCGAPSVEFTTNEAGEFSVQYTVRRFLTSPLGGPTTDCADASSSCIIGAAESVTPGATAVGPVSFVPQTPPPPIFGTVTDPSDNPVVGTSVWAYTPTDTWIGSLQTTTDGQGSYAFESIEPGVAYRILFHHPAGSTSSQEWFDDRASRQAADVISLQPGQFLEANAQLDEGGTISGSVTDAGGNPIAGVAVWAFGPGDTWVGSYVASSTSAGTYLVENVRPADYKIRFLPPAGSGFALEWFDNAPIRRSGDLISVLPGQGTTGIDAVLEQSP